MKASSDCRVADRLDPRLVLGGSAIAAAGVNAGLLVAEPGGVAAIALRLVTGVLMAGVYPVGMKLAVGWGVKDRGFLVGLLVGGLTIGSASSHLVAFFGGADWRTTVSIASLLAGVGTHVRTVCDVGVVGCRINGGVRR